MGSGCELVASHRTDLEWARVGQYVGKLNEHGNNVPFSIWGHAPNITSTLIGAITRLRADCSIQFANDVSWIDLQRSDLWFTLHHADMRRGIIGYQAPSYSDVQHVHIGSGVR